MHENQKMVYHAKAGQSSKVVCFVISKMCKSCLEFEKYFNCTVVNLLLLNVYIKNK